MTPAYASECARRALLVLGLGALAYACGDSEFRSPQDADAPDAALAVNPCAEQPDGRACGEDRHCVAERCLHNVCGDGIAAGAEQCDDGNAALGDTCSPSCKATPESCGNGVVDEDEECDDGNRSNEDACSNSCTVTFCGNGRKDPGEQCDDGNGVDTDTCSNQCIRNLCRNGIVDPSEECDDGNTNNLDGCNNRCKVVRCGDGQVDDGEECDDENRVDDDDCSNQCLRNACGNARLDPGELCDGDLSGSGPIPTGSRCSPDCQRIESDACRPCGEQHCRNYQDSGYDLMRYCYEEPALGTILPDFNERCINLAQCVLSNRCDLTWQGSRDGEPHPLGCYCGQQTTFDDCAIGAGISGPCQREYEAATDAIAGDYNQVLSYSVDLTFPSGNAHYLLACLRGFCEEECR